MYILCVIDIYKINIEAVMIEKIKQFNLYLRWDIGVLLLMVIWVLKCFSGSGHRLSDSDSGV